MEAKKHDWNKKVANKRGNKWRKSLLTGRLSVQMNPSAIRLTRIRKTKTQAEIATKVGLSVSTYMAIEAGKRPASEENAKEISSALNIPFDKAFKKSEIKNRFEAVR